MPDEIRPLLRLAGKYRREKIEGFDAYRFAFGEEKVLLIKSGMGLDNGAAAAHALVKAKPCIIINFGFCGGVKPGPRVGDIVMAQRILLNREALFSPQSGIVEEDAKRLARFLADALNGRELQVYGGTFVTTAGIRSKDEMANLIPVWALNPVLEMETAAVAKAAAKEMVPFLAVRGVSDDASEELGFSIDELTDSSMKLRFGKVLLTVARKPRIIPQMLRLAKNSRAAGESLALAVAALLEDTDELPLKRIRRH